MALGTTAAFADRTALLPIQARGSNKAGSSETRARIVKAATQLYRRIGHKKTTVADIAHDMSMSPANVYRFFPSKHAIESAVVEKLLDEVLLFACEATCRDDSAAERVRTVLRALERLHAAHFVSDHRLHLLIMTATRENWFVVSSHADRLNSTVAQIISEGQARGEFSDGDPMMLASCVLGATTTYLNPLLIGVGASSSRPTLDQLIDFCIGALCAPMKLRQAEKAEDRSSSS
jgi:AcrR family transcriptional regulator